MPLVSGLNASIKRWFKINTVSKNNNKNYNNNNSTIDNNNDKTKPFHNLMCKTKM